MSPSLKLIEQVKLINDISTNWACFQSEDNRIAMLSLAGAYIWELSNIKDNTMALTAYKKKLIEPSKYNPCLHLDIDSIELLKKLPKEYLFETVLRTDLTPHYAFGVSQIHVQPLKYNAYYPINCWWSTEEAIDNNQCVIAVLSHYFCLNIYRKQIESTSVNKYVEVCNVSKFIVDYFKRHWDLKNDISPTEKLEELKFRIRRVSVLAATWTNLIYVDDEKFVVLIVALAYGSIVFLKFPQIRMGDFSHVNLTFLGEYTENFQQISSLHWINTIDKNSGFLYFGTFSGTISCVPIINISSNSVEFCKQLDYITACDNLTVSKILHNNYKNYSYLFISKRNYFIVILSNSDGTVLDIKCLRIGTMQINGLNLFENNIIMLVTQVGIVKELRINCNDGKLSIHWKYIYVDINWKKKKCNGWFISRNQSHFGFLTTATQITTSNDRLLVNPIVLLYVNRDRDLIKILQENTSSLRNYWDCLETIRICTILDKHDYYSTAMLEKNYNNMSLVQLKTNYWLSHFFEHIKSYKENVIVDRLKPSKDIRAIININIAIIYLRKLLDKSWKQLTDFERQSVVPSWIFLREIVAEDALNKLKLDEPLTSSILHILFQLRGVDLPEPLNCLYCEEKLVSSSCIEKHYDCRCAISQMQILQAKLICPICKSPIHEELRYEFNVVLCPFCDVSVEHVDEINRIPNNKDNSSIKMKIDSC